MKKLNVNAIRIDGGTQARVSLNEATVAEYADCLDDLPPVVVFFDGSDNWLADGFHRLHAFRKAGKASIPADIRTGTQRDAILFSLGANRAHGLRVTNADKRKAVAAMLEDAEWAQWSDRKIAETCGVSVPFVSAIRRPEVAARQQEHRAAQYPTEPKGCNPITPAAAPQAPATTPPADAEPEYFGPSAEELAEAEREQEAEMAAFRLVLDADDKLAAAVAEVKRLTIMNGVLESRVEGLMNEKNALIQAAKKWQRKAEKAERALKESA